MGKTWKRLKIRKALATKPVEKVTPAAEAKPAPVIKPVIKPVATVAPVKAKPVAKKVSPDASKAD